MRELLRALDAPRSRTRWWLAAPVLAALVATVIVFAPEEEKVIPPAPAPAAKPSPTVVDTPRTELVVEPAAAVAFPKQGALIVLPLDGARTFVVDHLTVVRIDDPDIIDIEVRDGALTMLGTKRGSTTLTLEFGKRAQSWPIEVRVPVAEAPRAVTLARGETREFVFAGVTRVTLGDARIVDLVSTDGGALYFKANTAGSTNALVWTGDARRVELRFDIRSAQSLDLIVGLQEVLNVDDVEIVTVTPSSLCDVTLLSRNEVLLTPSGVGQGVLKLEHRDGTEELRELKVSRK